jgi:uncharacterized protein with von Willebrand factor type A (vWA) domain
MLIKYSRWDGTQNLPDFDADDALAAMADDLMADGDLRRALQRMLRWGAETRDGDKMPGLRDLMERLRQQRKQQLDRYSMSDIVKDLQDKLDDVLKTEREGIERRLDEGRQKAASGEHPNAEQLQQMLEKMAAQKQQQLDQLPDDLGGAIKGLQDYDFMDPEARRKFQELMEMLQQQLMQSHFQGMQQAMQNMGPQQMQALRQMVRDLNQMLREKAEGGQPDFRGFMDKWGELFPGVQNLDQLIEQMQRQAAQMQSLLDSMSPDQRQQLEDLMESILKDQALQQELAELAMNLEELYPMQDARRYPFRGDEPLTLQEAMKLMGELQELDQLEKQLRSADDTSDIEGIDADELRRLLGDESADQLEQLKRLTKMLEEAGYLEQKGRRWELTPLAVRKIGQKALRDIFSRLKRDRFGKHETEQRGAGGDPTDQSKRYEFGDPFILDLKQTLRNSIDREGPGTPLRLKPDDFEVHRTELLTQCSTVVMLDMSRSMIYRDCWNAAKRVALALNTLIRGQYPRDELYIVGFSLYARQYQPEALPYLMLTELNYGTNMQHGLKVSRQLLGKHKGGNKQVIMITDGEPTAHLEGTHAYFDYPTTPRTYQQTRAEVTRCTREGITINTFMLEDSPGLMHFVNQMTQINKGRAFYATPDRLGEYILVDYVNQKQKRVG